MKFRKAGLGLSVFAGLAFSTLGQAYQLEVTGAYIDVSTPGGGDSALGLGAEFHFTPVDTGSMPLAEAGFLRRSSHLSVGYLTMDKADSDTLSAGLELFQESLYLLLEVDSEDPGVGQKTNAWEARVGVLPAAGLLITLGYADYDDAADTSAMILGAKYVVPMIADTAMNFEGDITAVDDNGDTVVIDLSADYFFNSMFSAGVRVEDTDNDFVKTDTKVGVGARYFFSPLMSGQVEYTSQDKIDAWLLALALRF